MSFMNKIETFLIYVKLYEHFYSYYETVMRYEEYN